MSVVIQLCYLKNVAIALAGACLILYVTTKSANGCQGKNAKVSSRTGEMNFPGHESVQRTRY